MDSRPSNHLPLLAALVSVVLWAAAFVGIRAAGRSFSPGALALGRLTIGSVLLGGLVLSRPILRPTKRELGLLVLAGLLWFGVYNLVLNDAERRVDAGTAAMLVLIAPIFIIALAAAFLQERTTPNLLLGGGQGVTRRHHPLSAGRPLVLDRSGRREAGAQQDLGTPGNLDLLRGGSAVLPALRAAARPRDPPCPRRRHRLDAVPRRVPHVHRVYDLGVRTRARLGRSCGGDGLPHSADPDRDELGDPGRSAGCD